MIQQALKMLSAEAVRPLRPGGQKTVLLVNHKRRPAVLKVISVGDSRPDALQRARREIGLLTGIDSQYLVHAISPLVELGAGPEGVAWLEVYLPGTDLSELVGPLWPWAETSRMAHDVASGLHELHSRHIVHRDLSANNIRQVDAGPYVVMDPGYARHLLRSRLTFGGQPGTYGYFSPEHLHGYSGAPTPASDVFCLGILMFQCLSGHLPIPVTDEYAYLQRLRKAQVDDLYALRPDLTSDQIGFVHHCLHPQSARRPRTASQVLNELEGLA